MLAKLDGGYLMKPVAFVHSPFKGRCGTPRQGSLAPAARGLLVFENEINPAALDDVKRFSHVWVIFIFNQNTNLLGLATREGQNPDSRGWSAKVHPPRLFGKKVGVFSTRTPHRPNPIGLTVVRVERVVGKTVVVSGLDMCHGTPVLDIKPYIPWDVIQDPMVPPWVTAEDVPKWDLIIRPQAEADLRAVLATKGPPLEKQPSLRFYEGYEGFLALLRDVLLQDVRSVHQGRGTAESVSPYCCNLDGISVEFVTRQDALEVCRAFKEEKEWSWDALTSEKGQEESSLDSAEERVGNGDGLGP